LGISPTATPQPQSVVWCAISEFGVWVPYFFEEDALTVTVTSNRYCAMAENFLQQKMCGFNKMVQQPTHLIVRSEFSEMFPGHVVSLRGDIGWPLHSPDLTSCDFFLWGYLKAQVYQHRPQTLEGLKEAITQEVAAILPKMTSRVMEKCRGRLNQCINNEGRHLSEVVFKF
jgi:hypothetical protein